MHPHSDRQAESRPLSRRAGARLACKATAHARSWTFTCTAGTVRLFPRGPRRCSTGPPRGVHDRPDASFGAPKAVDERETSPLSFFAIGAGVGLRCPTSVIGKRGTPRHPLAAPPAYGIVLGVVNVRGRIAVCGVARPSVGLESPPESIPGVRARATTACSCVRRDGVRVVLPR